jgi:hypothetical protein
MNKDEKEVYNVVTALIGELQVTVIKELAGSEDFSWSKCVKHNGYCEILKRHNAQETTTEIANATGNYNKQVQRVIDKHKE